MSAWGWFAVIGGAVCAVLNAVNGEWPTAMFAALCAALYVILDWSLRTAEELGEASNRAMQREAAALRALAAERRKRLGLYDDYDDAGSTTLGHALGVVVVLGGLLLLLAVAGAIEGGGL